MSATIEIELLDECMLDGEVPCGMYLIARMRMCGVPSVARVRVKCHNCLTVDICFTCEQCLELVRAHRCRCRHCVASVVSLAELL